MGKLDDLSLKMVEATLKFADVALSKEVSKTVKTHALIDPCVDWCNLYGNSSFWFGNYHLYLCTLGNVCQNQ